jgi:hypothetical protein
MDIELPYHRSPDSPQFTDGNPSKGFNRASSSLASVCILFLKKGNRSLYLCMDY